MKDDRMQATFENAKSMLVDAQGQPTEKYQSYMRFQKEYADKKKEYTDAYAHAMKDPQRQHLWGMEGKAYIDLVNQAWDKWVVLGFKNEVESSIDILAANPSYADVTKNPDKQ